MMKSNLKHIKNEKGILTIDFLFAFMMIFGFTAVLYSFALTLSVVEVVQYVSYATARNYSLAHMNEGQQRARGQAKFAELTQNPTMRPFITAGWYSIADVQIGDFNDDFSPESSMDSDNFLGARIPFSAPILYKRIPFLGNTGTDPDGFNATISSFLAREPTFEECQGFMQQREQAITTLGYSASGVVVIMDNGC